MLIHIPPFMDWEIASMRPPNHIDILNCLVCVRLFTLFWMVRNHSGFYSSNTAYVGRTYGVKSLGFLFNLKMLFRDHSLWVIVPGAMTIVLVTSM